MSLLYFVQTLARQSLLYRRLYEMYNNDKLLDAANHIKSSKEFHGL